jgi:hypothetical protein
LADSCSFQAFGWVCGSTGYLGVEGAGGSTGLAYPCPQCNTRVFLEKAYAHLRKTRYAFRKCPCCGPGMAGEELWDNAVETARECNPAVTNEVLTELRAMEATSCETSSGTSDANQPRYQQGSVRL